MPDEQVHFITFNQDALCVAVGVSTGCKVFTVRPNFGKCLVLQREAIGLIEMLYSTSLIATVALGEEPGLLPRKLKIINTKRQLTICDLIFPAAVLSVRLGRRHMVVVLEDQIYVYDINTMLILHTIETSPNPRKLCAVSEEPLLLLAYPLPPKTATHELLLVAGVHTNGGVNLAQTGVQLVSNAPNRVGDVIIFDLTRLQPFAVIEAHKAALAAMCLLGDGTLLATASEKGTIVRVFSVSTGVKLYQFRRGTYPTKIYSLTFSPDNKYVVATSASETVHIFRLGEEELLENKHSRSRLKDVQEEDEQETYEDTYDDGDDSDAEDELELPQRKLSQGLSASFASVNSVVSDEKAEPVVDQTRLSVARIIRRSSQTLGRKAAQKMGDFLPLRFSSILEPTRHFASLKIHALGRDVRLVAVMGNVNDEGLIPVHVATSGGTFYTYALDPERGGDCIMLQENSLLDE